MAHFAYYFPLGVCPPSTVIPNGFFSQIDQNLFKAVNGDDGGTWAPAGAIRIGGAGLNVTGFFNAASSNFTADVSIGSSPSDPFAVFGTATFSAPTASFVGISASGNFSGNTGSFTGSVSASSFDASGNVIAANIGCSGQVATSTLLCSGAATMQAGMSVAGTSALHTTSVAGPLTVAGGGSITSVIACSGAGRTPRPAVIGAASGGGTASPQAGNTYYFPTVTADQTYQISDTGAVDGDELEFWTESATHIVTVNDPLGSPLQTIKNATGSFVWMKAKRILGSWKLVGLTTAP